MNRLIRYAPVMLALAAVAVAAAPAKAQVSPEETETATINGKKISIKYCAPSVHGRKIFGDGGRISSDPNYPVWRAGANSATALHTDAELNIGGLNVPKGDYTVYALVKDPNAWELIINKQTGQWGLTYNQPQDLGRVKMDMSKPASPIETLKYTITSSGGGKGKLTLAWDDHIASVPITVK